MRLRHLFLLMLALPVLATGGAAVAGYLSILNAGWPASLSMFASFEYLLSVAVGVTPAGAAQVEPALAAAGLRSIPLEAFGRGAFLGALAGGLLALVAVVLFAKRGTKKEALMAAQGRRIQKAASLHVGTIAIPRKFENRHFLAAGATGCGKSQTIRAAALLARKRGEPAMVLDIGSELTTRLYREGVDVILGAYDARSVSWSPLAEMRGEYHAERVAAAMIPEAAGAEGKEWSGYARNYTEAVLVALWRHHEAGERVTNRDLSYYLTSADPAQLLEEVGADHPAAGLLSGDNEKMLGSVRGIAGSRAKALRGLDPDAGFDSWSIADYVAEVADAKGKDAGWLFVPVPAELRDAAFPLASMVAGFVIDRILSLPESDRRFWSLCDELGQYPQISALSRALTLGRKYGLVQVGAVQSVSQLRDTYGRDGSQTLLSCFGTKAIYRCGDADTAEWASKEIGDHQVSRVVESESQSQQGNNASHSTSYSEQITIERNVLASEIQGLDDLRAYVLSPAIKAVKRVDVPYIDIGEQRAPAFVQAPRKPRSVEEPPEESDLQEMTAEVLPEIESFEEAQADDDQDGSSSDSERDRGTFADAQEKRAEREKGEALEAEAEAEATDPRTAALARLAAKRNARKRKTERA